MPAAKLSSPPTPDELHELVTDLNRATSLSLALAEESVTIDDKSVAATAISSVSAKEKSILLQAIAKVFISEPEDGSQSTWALIFFYLDGHRVAPPGFSHMVFAFEESEGWQKTGWEIDENGEWGELDAFEV